VWFAVLFPTLAGFVAALIAICLLTRHEPPSAEPLLSFGVYVLASLLLSVPGLVVNALVFRTGSRTRVAWFVRAVPIALVVTLGILMALVGLFWLARLGMTH